MRAPRPPHRSSPMPLPPPSRPSGGATICSRSHCSAGPAGLLVVGHDRVRRVEPGHGRDLVQDVGALERHARADPRRGRDGDVGLVGRDRTRADHGGVQVGNPADHRRPRGDAELGRDVGQQRAEHRACGDELGQPRAVAPRPGDERVDVAQRRAEPVVGEPGRDHRGRRRRGPAGEPQAQVVDRLEDHGGLLVDVGSSSRSSSEWPVGSAPLGPARRR